MLILTTGWKRTLETNMIDIYVKTSNDKIKSNPEKNKYKIKLFVKGGGCTFRTYKIT